MGELQKVAGLILFIIAMILFVYSIPTMTTSVSTRSGSALENESSVVKNFLGLYDILFAIIPIVLFVAGVGLLWVG